MTTPTRADIHKLLSEREWLARLARRLLGDGPDADDLAQETLSRALQSGTVPARPRSWLSRVARNLRLESLRGDARRRAREEEVARPEASSDGDVIERASLRHRLLEHVLELPEPERTAIVLRYLEDLPYEEVAARQQASVVAVRKRVSRAVERLRNRLDRAQGGRDAWAGLLGPLSGLRPTVGPVVGAATSPLILASGVLGMSTQIKLALGGGVVAALIILAVTRFDPVRPMVGAGPAEPPVSSVLMASEDPTLADYLGADSQETDRRIPEPLPATAEDNRDLEETIDRYARGKLRIHVTDRAGADISQATIAVTGFRSEATPGAGHAWRYGSPRVKTNTVGIAEIDYPVWELGTNGDWLPLSKIIFTTEHPQYSTQGIEGSVEGGEVHVVLEYGSTLIVSGWIDSPTERILDLDPLLSYSARVGGTDWVPVRDGRLSCNRIPPGRHVIVLRHDLDGVPYSSEGVEFELVEADQTELHLQLVPPRTLRGIFDPRVPRPMEHGRVEVAVESGARERRAVLAQDFFASVRPDGSFELDLPPGEIEIIGLCNGWTSVSFSASDLEYVRRTQIVPRDHEGEFVLKMEPAASLEVTVLNPAGDPLKDATVQMSPNVHWKTGYSQLFVGTYEMAEMARRRWFAVTNEDGVAHLANLPPKMYESVIVIHAGLRMPIVSTPWGQERRGAWIDLESGEVAKLTVQLEEGED